MAALLVWGAASCAFAQPSPPPHSVDSANAPVGVSAAAERIYAAAQPSLLQVRTLVGVAGRQSTVGSGFVVGPNGLAMTNYHVVSQYALDPGAYRLEFARPDGTHGALSLVAIDVADDLAVVRLAGTKLPAMTFDPSVADISRGERIFAIGNPLDLGFAIAEGTYNGLVARSYIPHVQFTGALNPGMSGGPAVNRNGQVVGINVASRRDGELVSFLVPAAKAVALLRRIDTSASLTPDQAKSQINRQVLAWQRNFVAATANRGFRTATFGAYQAPESAAPWFDCWAQTNVDQVPKPRARVDSASCMAQSALFVADGLQIGSIGLAHTHIRSDDLNAFQFAAFASRYYARAPLTQPSVLTRSTHPECHEDFVAPADATRAPVLRAVWCARAYRDFAGVYDVWLTTITQDRSGEALVSRLTMRGVAYDAALALAQQVMGAITWKK